MPAGDQSTRYHSTPADRGGWRGRRRREADGPRHGWQGSSATQAQKQQWARRVRQRLLLGGLFLLFAVCLGLLIHSLLFAPPLTPLIAITATAYDYPLPPNAWTLEDKQALGDLDAKTLTITDLSDAWETGAREEALIAFRRQLKALAEERRRYNCIVIYVSMHGAAACDNSGQATAYLVPPGSSSLDPSTWLPLRDVLGEIGDVEGLAGLHKLLVLDCSRDQANWDLLQLYNSFAGLLPGVVHESGVDNLAVLNSAGPGQVSWASDALRGSAFGCFLRAGLAGEADRPKSGGDGNRRVSLSELRNYLHLRVDQWARDNRDARQQPEVFTTPGTADFDVVWVSKATLPSRPERIVSDDVREIDTAGLWQRRDSLRSRSYGGVPAGPNRFDPLAWRDFEKRIVWLERMLDGGAAYDGRVLEVWQQLNGQYVGVPDEDDGIRGYWETYGERSTLRDTRFHVHNLPLSTWFGVLEGPTRSSLSDVLRDLQSVPTRENLGLALRQLDSVAESDEVPALAEVQYIRRLSAGQSTLPWSRPEDIRKSLTLRHLVERLAAPADERTIHWIRPLLDTADEHRRPAEDLLFGLDASAGEAAGGEWEKVQSACDAAKERTDIVAAAFALRDEVWSQAAYLAWWYSRPAQCDADAAAYAAQDAAVAKSFREFIASAHQLDRLLARQAQSQDACEQLRSTLNEVRKRWPAASESGDAQQSVRGEFEQQVASLISADELDARGMRQALDILSTPLPSAADRRELRDRVQRFQHVAREQPKEIPDAESVSLDHYTRRMRERWSGHPLLAILRDSEEGPTAEPGDADTSSLQNSLVQQAIVASRRLRGIPKTIESLHQSEVDGSVETAIHWSLAEQMIRPAAPIWYPSPPVDPIASLRKFDLQQLLVWQARRSLEDFSGVAVDGRPFFELAADDYQHTAESILPLTAEQREHLSALRGTRVRAAVNGVTATARSRPRATEDEELEVDVTVTVEPTLLEQSPGVKDAPSGYLAIWIRDLSGEVLASSAPQRLPLADEVVTLSLPVEPLNGAGPLLRLVAAYRGHEYRSTFEIDDFGGQRIDYEPARDATTQITVFDRAQKERSIVFILDCSGSMKEKMLQDGVERTQMDIAKSALLKMLGQLAQMPGVRVGVLFYGHRVGWSKDQPVEILTQTDYARISGEISPDLMPSVDVESIHDLGRFDLASVGKVSHLLKGVRPWGQTPLYLSLVEALNQFSRDDAGTDKSIVVITDGVDHQFTPSSSPVRPPKTGKGEVEQALQNLPVPIYIVGFGVPEDERAMAKRQFEELAALSRGEAYSVDEAPDLIKTLQGLLGQTEFTIHDALGRDVGVATGQVPQPAPLGTPLTIHPPPRTGDQYRVMVDTAVDEPVRVTGGEWLEFALSDDGRRLRPVPFEKDAVADARLVDPDNGAPTEYRMRVHQPLVKDNHVEFTVSIQDETSLVTPRPTEVWTEIAPLDSSGAPAGAAYIFYDAQFAPRKPVPVLQLIASNWPEGAERAAVRVGCGWTDTPPTESVSLRDVLGDPQAFRSNRALDGVPGVTYEIRVVKSPRDEAALRISVIEQYTDESLGFPAMKVAVVSEDGTEPRRVIRRFDARHHTATHSFIYAREAAKRIEKSDGAQIVFTSRASLLAGALKLADDEPLHVNVYESSDLLILRPPDGG